MKKTQLIIIALFMACVIVTAQQSTNYIPFYNNNSFNAKIVDVSKPVGTINGNAGVANGAASYTIPIATPPRPNNGIPAPEISISYNSMGGDGALGKGWNINGVSTIQRTQQTIAQENITQPVCTGADIFTLDGNKLIFKGGNSTILNWTTEIETFANITSSIDANGSITQWIVKTKDGSTFYYGSEGIFADNNSGQNNNCNISAGGYLVFFLDHIIFPNGNARYYEYITINQNEKKISSISDDYARINFNYKERIDKNQTYISGKKIESTTLLDNIEILNSKYDLFKKYNFRYSTDNINSVLSEIEEEGIGGLKLNSTTFYYGERSQEPNFTSNSQIFEIPEVNAANKVMYYQSGDFNGDGYSDILVIDQTTSLPRYTTGFRVFINNKNNSYSLSYSQSNLNNNYFYYDINRYLNFLTSDFNGDGIDDIIIHEKNMVYKGSIIYLFNKQGSVTIYGEIQRGSPSCFSETYNLIPSNSNNPFSYSGDFNGDGAIDYITLLSNSNVSVGKIFINYPSMNLWDKPVDVNNSIIDNIINANNVYIIDFDGDGKSEIMAVKDNMTNIFSFNNYIVSKNTSGQVTEISPYLNQIYSGGFPTKWHKIILGDFNGDKKTDLLTKSDATGYDVSFSNGNYFEFSSTINFLKTPNLTSSDESLKVSDFNGDGKSDILHIYREFSLCNNRVDLYYSAGKTFIRKSVPQINNFYFLAPNSQVVVGDFNGDGKADLNSRTNGLFTGTNPYSTTCSFMNPSGINYARIHTFFDDTKNDLTLKKIKNGHGQVSEFTYNTLAQISTFSSTYNNTNNYNENIYIKLPINVVTNFKNSEANMDLSYSYFGAMINKKGRGFLGFRQIDQTDNLSGDVAKTYLNKFSFFSNYPDIVFNDYTETYKNNVLFTTNRAYYDAGINDGKRLWLKLIKKETTNYLSGNNTENYIYDSYGNITSKEEINADGKTSKIQFIFGANAPNRPALPVSTTTTFSKQGTPDISYSTQYEYTPWSQLKKKIEYDGLPKTITTEYLYNNTGNIIEEKTTGTGMPSRKTEWVYDQNGQFLVKKKNSLGQEINYLMDEKWNKPLIVTGIDGLTTSYLYDGFGREILETDATGKSIQTQFLWDNSINVAGNSSLYKIIKSSPNSPTEEVYIDKIDRQIAKREQQFNGSFNTSQNYYDTKNRLYKNELLSPNGSMIQGSRTVFDPWDRPIENYTIDNTSSESLMAQTAYNKGSNYWEITNTIPSSVSNPNGTSEYSKISLGGELLQKTKNGTNELYFDYNAEGKPLKVWNNTATFTESQYDAYGRQTKLIDNSAGTQTYVYNVLGELTQQNNPNNGFVKYEYDLLGRKTKEIINEGTITYTYFPSGSGVKTNLLKEIKGYNSQNKEEYDYDPYGRPSNVKRTIAGSPVGVAGWTTQFFYNNNGQIAQKIAPSGNVYEYQYNAFGFLNEIKKGSKSIYTLNASSPSGKPMQFTLGSTPVSYTYDALDRLSSIQSSVINDEYTWDPINGNLLTKKEHKQNFDYSYQYDNFERLTQENLVANGRTINNPLSYLDDGRINEKYSATGIPYQYHTDKRFAVKTIGDAYDFSPYPQSVNYSSFNKPTKLSQNGNELTYTYNHNYHRLTAVLTKNGSPEYKRYYCGSTDFNFDRTNTLLHAIDYIYAGDQLVAMDISTPSRNETWYVQQDYQSHVRAVFDDNGQTYYQNFDAWGNYRELQNTATTGDISYTRPTNLPAWLYRGYTEQEHLPEFGLINLNARLYDPHISRMLSPDNYVTAKSLEGFNRYSYAHNNPMKYTDKDGNFAFVPLLVGVALGAYLGGVTSNNCALLPWQWQGKTWINVLAGGIAGGVGVGFGAWMNSLQIGGMAGGAISGGASGFAAATTTGIYHIADGTTNFGGFLSEVGLGTFTGGAIGGAIGGIDAAIKGDRIWDGNKLQFKRVNLPGNTSIPNSDPSTWTSEERAVYESKLNILHSNNSSFGSVKSGQFYRSDHLSKNINIPDGAKDINVFINAPKGNGLYTMTDNKGKILFQGNGKMTGTIPYSPSLKISILGGSGILVDETQGGTFTKLSCLIPSGYKFNGFLNFIY